MFQPLQKAATEGRSLSMNRGQDERVRSLVIRKELKEEPMFRSQPAEVAPASR